MKGWRYPCGLIGALALPSVALAQAETTTFEYDALGRLIEAESVQASGPDVTNSYAYDNAHNRTSDTVTQSGSLAPPLEAPSADPSDEPEE